MTLAGAALRHGVALARDEREDWDDYPLAFWGLVFFSFIVFVAPQNIYEALRPLHLAKTAAVLALVAYVGQRLAHGRPLFPAGREVRLLAFLVCWAVLSVPNSRWPGGSLEVLTDFYAKSLLVCLLMAQVLASPRRFRQLLWCLLGFGLVIAVIALSGFSRGLVVEGYRMRGAWGGLNSNPNDFALTLNLLIPFAVALFLLSRGLGRRALLAGFLVVAVGAILATYSRGGFITLASILGLLLMRFFGRGLGLRTLLPLLLLGLAAWALVPEGYGTRLESILETSKDRVGSSTARLTSMTHALDLVAEHPLFGVGLGMNILALNAKGLWWTHVHNVYLQIAAEVGLPGLLAFLLLVRELLRGLRRVQAELQDDERHREVAVLAAACEVSLLAFCVAAMFHPVAYHFYFYYLAGFAMALRGIAERAPVDVADEPDLGGDGTVGQVGLAPLRAGPPLWGAPHA